VRRGVRLDGGALAREAVAVELAFAGDPEIPKGLYQTWHGAWRKSQVDLFAITDSTSQKIPAGVRFAYSHELCKTNSAVRF
jgi:hypothetical protein